MVSRLWLTALLMIVPLAPANAVALGSSGSPGTGIAIDFDDQPVPCFFAETGPLRDKYDDLGVHFQGLGSDGGAILDGRCSFFNVLGYSKPNFLAFNKQAMMANGGIPQPPERITFASPVGHVEMNLASRYGDLIRVLAYDTAGRIIGRASRNLTNAVQLVSIDAVGIASVSVNTTAANWVLDDLAAR